MKFTVYSSVKNISDYQQGLPILCYPERQSQHDIAYQFNYKNIILLSNQAGLYICKRPSLFKKFLNLFKKSSK